MGFNWTCPYCSRAQTVTENRYSRSINGIGINEIAEGTLAVERVAIGCSNPECKRVTFSVKVGQSDASLGYLRVKPGTSLFSEQLLPRGIAKPQPSYIPVPLVEDYTEACLIKDLSPKASATLSRRCLQGMIRDFAKIAKNRLIDEIDALKAAVNDGSADRAITPETVEAIDHVRGLGNIGAHMEKEIDVIVPVDPGEAQNMIELIEMLFDEWYGARERRRERLASIAHSNTAKQAVREAARERKSTLSDLLQTSGGEAPIEPAP